MFTSILSPKPTNSADMITIELPLTEYASVGYMAKRIQMRKNRFLAIQKMAEQKKNEALHASNANINNDSNNLDLGPKQTVSPIFKRMKKLLTNSSILLLKIYFWQTFSFNERKLCQQYIVERKLAVSVLKFVFLF